MYACVHAAADVCVRACMRMHVGRAACMYACMHACARLRGWADWFMYFTDVRMHVWMDGPAHGIDVRMALCMDGWPFDRTNVMRTYVCHGWLARIYV
jgi:hypothetical protein